MFGGKGCKDCSNYQSESRLTCPKLLQKAYERIKEYEEMDRLTKTGYKFAEKQIQVLDDMDRWLVAQCLNRLSEYEDLEEQGRLLKLPISIGDTVYEISSKLLPLRIKNFEISADGIYANIVSDVYGYKFLRMTLNIDNLGKTWFVTREQAEAALKELEVKK